VWTNRPRPEPLAGRQAECRPRFPDQKGWYGGDAAFSVPLSTSNRKSDGGRLGRHSLWLFGDTFVERPDAPPGRQYPFVHNTIAVSRCDPGGGWTFDPFWRSRDDGEPTAFFMPDPAADWVRRAVASEGQPYYWPFGGFLAEGALFVGLLRVVPSEPRGPFQLPFRLVGMDLARIENPREAPPAWRIRISTLSTDPVAFPASAFALDAAHLYAFAFFDRGDGRAPRMLARLDREALREWQPDLTDRLETWTTDSAWQPGFRPEEAAIVMDDDATEMSVHFDSVSRTWLAVYGAPEPEAETADRIWLRSAPTPSGPWSIPHVLFTIPETIPSGIPDPSKGEADRPDEQLFCYAGKAHPQFSPPDGLLLTYVCNLFTRDPSEMPDILERLRRDSNLYRPRSVVVELPGS
jgi:hypothetical protein